MLRALIRGIAKIAGAIFFDSKWLVGRYFDERLVGWRWVLRGVLWQKIFGFNRHVPWPVSPWIVIGNPANLDFHPDDIQNFQTFGCYFQNYRALITIGRGTYIAPNVGIITSNHDPADPDRHLPDRPVTIGAKCWIGMNAVILPGVVLGPHTTVAAGAVVTSSFPEGYCVVGGVPARLLRQL